MSDSEGGCVDRRRIDQEKACHKSLVATHARVASLLPLEVVGCLRPLAARVPFIISRSLPPSLDLRANRPKPRLFVSPVGPNNQRCHEAA